MSFRRRFGNSVKPQPEIRKNASVPGCCMGRLSQVLWIKKAPEGDPPGLGKKNVDLD
jgi:hypothetical protein